MKVSGLYSGLVSDVYIMSDSNDITEIDDELNDIVSSNQQDAVVSLVIFPKDYINTTIDSDRNKLIVAEAVKNVPAYVTVPTVLDGDYTPRNKKLLTYPYSFLCIDTLCETKNYRYEYFTETDANGRVEFDQIGCISPNPEILVMPKYYNGSNTGTNHTVLNATESVTCSGFPQCAFVIDSYRAWLAQKATDVSLALKAQTVSKIAGWLSFTPSSIVNTVQNTINETRIMNEAVIEATAGSKVRGNSGGSANVASRAMAIYYKKMSITKQFARMIDDYFDRFGYATGRIKIPNRDVRPHWTYTKTVDVAIRGSVPVDDMRAIKDIYNRGITFWKNGSEVGNYSLNNAPVSS